MFLQDQTVQAPAEKREWLYVENTHEPIIDRDLWNKVQALIAQRAKPFDTGNIGLFARKARCANCGYTMLSSKTSPQRGASTICSVPTACGQDACIGSFISVDRLEKMVIAEIKKLAAEYLDRDELEQKIEFCDTLKGRKNVLLRTCTPTREGR